MYDLLCAVVLGIVEGITEFLPISSTGHMILVMPLLGIHEGQPTYHFWNGAFDIFIQMGAILAVVIYFWRRLYKLTVDIGQQPWHEHMLFKLFIAFLPAAIIGKLASDYVEEHLKIPVVVAGALIVGGILIILIERVIRHPRVHDAAAVSLPVALGIGLAQCLAMIPGTSRSAATIIGALVLGLSSVAAAEFSFFLAIPTLSAASLYALLKHIQAGDVHWNHAPLLGVGFGVSFLVAWAVIAVFMKFIQTHRFTSFAVYRIILGGVVLATLWMHRQG